MKNATKSVKVAPSEVTPQNLSKLIDTMADGEEIVIKKVSGIPTVFIRKVIGGKLQMLKATQSLFSSLKPIPAPPSRLWHSAPTEIPEPFAAQKKAAGKGVSRSAMEKSMAKAVEHKLETLRMGLETAICFLSIGDATSIKDDGRDYLVFSLEGFDAYVRPHSPSKVVKALDKTSGKMIFLHQS